MMQERTITDNELAHIKCTAYEQGFLDGYQEGYEAGVEASYRQIKKALTEIFTARKEPGERGTYEHC